MRISCGILPFRQSIWRLIAACTPDTPGCRSGYVDKPLLGTHRLISTPRHLVTEDMPRIHSRLNHHCVKAILHGNAMAQCVVRRQVRGNRHWHRKERRGTNISRSILEIFNHWGRSNRTGRRNSANERSLKMPNFTVQLRLRISGHRSCTLEKVLNDLKWIFPECGVIMPATPKRRNDLCDLQRSQLRCRLNRGRDALVDDWVDVGIRTQVAFECGLKCPQPLKPRLDLFESSLDIFSSQAILGVLKIRLQRRYRRIPPSLPLVMDTLPGPLKRHLLALDNKCRNCGNDQPDAES